MSDRVWNTLRSTGHLFNAAQFVGGFFSDNLVQREAPFGIVQQAEVLLRLVDLNDIHESCWVEHISACFAIDLDQALHHNHLALAVCQGVLEALPQEHDEWQAL